MPVQTLWITPVFVVVLLATGLHLQQAQLPHPSWSLFIAILGFWGMVLGAVLMSTPRRLMQWQHPGTWSWSLAAHLAAAALLHPAWGVGALAWSWANHRAQTQLEQALPLQAEGQRLLVQGQILSLPQRMESGWRFKVAVSHATALDGSSLSFTLPPLMRVSVPYAASDAAPRVGEVWRWPLKIKAPHGFFNPHGDDAELRAWAQGVQVWGSVTQRRDAPQAQRLLGAQEAPPGSLEVLVERWRERVRDQLLQRLDQVQATATEASSPTQTLNFGVVLALLMGDQSAIAPSDWRLYRDTGIAHLMSISGLHITAWSLLVAALVRRLWHWADGQGWSWSLRWPAPQAASVLGLLASLAYALFSGWGLPAQRTVGMLALVVLLKWRGHHWPWITQWLGIAAVIALWQPTSLLSAGFWLSFLAVGVLLVETPLQPVKGQGLRSLAWRMVQGARTQWRVSLLMLPLTWVFFGQLSWVAALVNLWAIPWVSLVVLPLAVASVWWGTALGWAMSAVGWMREVLQWMVAWDWSVGWWPTAHPVWMVLAVLGAMVLVWDPWPWRWRWWGVLAVWPLLSASAPVPAWGELSLWVVDVGQGQAVVLRTRHQTWLYDAGPGLDGGWNAGEQVLLPMLRALGWPLHGLILSHADADHVGGAMAVLGAHPQLTWLGSLPPWHRLHQLRPGRVCLRGQRWWVDGVRFEVLHPLVIDNQRPTNRQSCVLRVQAASGSVLLMGDLEMRDEQALLDAGTVLRSEVLLVGHHGSRSSSSPAFLQAVSPRWALIQAGHLNPHGHPHASVVQALRDSGAEVVATPACGAMKWESVKAGQLQCERHQRRRYWQHPLGLQAVTDATR